MTHYDTLGIDPAASPEDVKRAYRKKVRKAHPDHGGSDDAAAKLNKAYEVIIDPRRRAEYDATGNDVQHSIEERAQQMVAQFFAAALEKDAPNLIVAARQMLSIHKDEAITTAHDAKRKVMKFTKRRDKITVKAGRNLVHMLIDDAVTKLDAMVEQAEEALLLNAAASAVVDAHESTEEVEIAMPSSFPLGSIFGTNTRGFR